MVQMELGWLLLILGHLEGLTWLLNTSYWAILSRTSGPENGEAVNRTEGKGGMIFGMRENESQSDPGVLSVEGPLEHMSQHTESWGCMYIRELGDLPDDKLVLLKEISEVMWSSLLPPLRHLPAPPGPHKHVSRIRKLRPGEVTSPALRSQCESVAHRDQNSGLLTSFQESNMSENVSWERPDYVLGKARFTIYSGIKKCSMVETALWSKALCRLYSSFRFTDTLAY